MVFKEIQKKLEDQSLEALFRVHYSRRRSYHCRVQFSTEGPWGLMDHVAELRSFLVTASLVVRRYFAQFFHFSFHEVVPYVVGLRRLMFPLFDRISCAESFFPASGPRPKFLHNYCSLEKSNESRSIRWPRVFIENGSRIWWSVGARNISGKELRLNK